jgi:hypothetical protein
VTGRSLVKDYNLYRPRVVCCVPGKGIGVVEGGWYPGVVCTAVKIGATFTSRAASSTWQEEVVEFFTARRTRASASH